MYDAAAIAFCTVSLTILAIITLMTFWWRRYRRQNQHHSPDQDEDWHRNQHQHQEPKEIGAQAQAQRGPRICPNNRVRENGSSNSTHNPLEYHNAAAGTPEYMFDCKFNRGWSGSSSVKRFAEELEQDDAMTDFAEATDSGGYAVEVVPDNNSPSPLNANERKNVVSAAASSSSQNSAEWEEQIRIVELEATGGGCSAKYSLFDDQYIAALLEDILSSQQLSPTEFQHMSLVPAPLNIRREREPGRDKSSLRLAPRVSRGGVGVGDENRTSRNSLYPRSHPHPLRSHPYGEADKKITTDTLQCPRPAHHRIQADEYISQQPIPGNRYNDSIIGRYFTGTGTHGSGCASESERWTMASEATLWV
ncbi:hypothetical protein HRR75_002573 [Exophiala dermatitidis]|nr:hypothetical protein HRR75_002573 [Exophiala dermatitidis]